MKRKKIDVDELDDISLFWLVIHAFEHYDPQEEDVSP